MLSNRLSKNDIERLPVWTKVVILRILNERDHAINEQQYELEKAYRISYDIIVEELNKELHPNNN
ncbi:MAG: hypothetical protein HUJ96_04610 [Marinilabiliaceae bacterium]|nr:hypothetical protein [Marinilabiliaceae bacterium]